MRRAPGLPGAARRWVAQHRILALCLSVAFLLRVACLPWATPLAGGCGPVRGTNLRSYHYDEDKVYRTTANFPAIYLRTDQPYPTYGTTLQYALGLVLIPVKVTFYNVPGGREYYPLFVWIVSRLISVLLGTLSVWFTFRLTMRLFDPMAGLFAALFLTFSLFHCLNSSLATLDVPLSCLLLVNILLALNASESGRRRDYVLLGVALGSLVGTKIVAALFVLVPVVLTLRSSVFLKSRASTIASLFLCFAIAGAVYAITNPHVLFDFSRFYSVMQVEQHDWLERLSDSPWTGFVKYVNLTADAVGWSILVLSAIGVCFVGSSAPSAKAALLLFVVAYYLFWRGYFAPRYAIAVAPLVCLFAGAAASRLVSLRVRIVQTAGALIVMAAAIHSLSACTQGIALRWNDTRPKAARYIAEHIPEGATVGIAFASEKYPWRWHAWRYPWIDFRRYRETMFLERPEYLVVSSFDMNPIAATLQSGKLNSVYDLDETYHREWYRYAPPSPEIFRFFDELLPPEGSPYVLLQSFRNESRVPLENPPPELRIYRRRESKG